MIHKYWVLVFDGKNWISYAGAETLEEAREYVKKAMDHGRTARIALLLEEFEK